MSVRPQLELPALDPDQLVTMTELADSICSALEESEPADDMIALFNAQAMRVYEPHEFLAVPGYTEFETFAACALTPDAPHLPDISREELVECARRLGGRVDDERAFDFYLSVFDRNTAHPALTNLWQEAESAEDFVDRALAWQPIIPPACP